MKAALTIALVSLVAILSTGGPSFPAQQSDTKPALSLTDRITSADKNIRVNARAELWDARQTTIKELIAIVNSPMQKDEKPWDLDSPHNIAIALLGELRASEAIDALIKFIALPML